MNGKIYWIAAILALVLNVATQAGLMMAQLKPPDPKVLEPLTPVQEWEYLISGWRLKCEEVELLAKTLRGRYEALDVRESQLAALQTTIQSEKTELQALRKDIDRYRNEVNNLILEVESAEQKNLKALATTYAALAPATTVSIFQHMDEDLVVKILHFMGDDAVVPIFETMAKEDVSRSGRRVAVLSEKLRRLYSKKS